MKKLFSALLILLAALLFLLPASAKPSGTEGDWFARLETQYRADNNNRALPQYAHDFYNWLFDAAFGEGGALRQPTAGVGGVVESKQNAGKSNEVTHLCYPVVTFTFDSTGMTEDERKAEARAQFEPYSQVTNHVLEAFRLDYPECNWLNNTLSFSQETSTPNSGETIITTCTLRLTLLSTNAEGNVTYDIRTTANPNPAALTALVEQAVEASGARALSKKEDKIDAINNYLTTINGYCSAETFGPAQYDPATALRGAYGENGPVCEGYARAFKLMCDALDIPCILVRGQAYHDDGQGEAHMWNQVKISDYWVGVDVTWNDPVVEGQEPAAVSGYERETYLRVKYAVMQNHFPETNGFAIPPILSITGNRANDATITQGDYTTPYEKIDDAITAFRDAEFDAVLTVCRGTTAHRDIELRGRQKLLTADNVTLTIDRNCKITVPGGADVELRGRFKSSSPDFLVHVFGTLKYSNTEIENTGGGVFLLEDGATLNQTGGGIKAKTFAVAICSPYAHYNFTGGGINLADGYMSAVLFDIPEDPNNTPQMTINNSVYFPNSTYPYGRPLQVVVTWRDTLVPIIRYNTTHAPNVTAAPGTELILSHDTGNRVFSARDNTADDLIAYIGSDNFFDISAALDAFTQAPNDAALVIFRDGMNFEIDRSITLTGGKKIITQNGAALTFTNNATITVPAGETGELNGEFKTDRPSCFIHVNGTLKISGGRICNERGVAIKLHEGATLNQTGGDICTPKAAVELVHPSAHYNFTGGQININNGYAGYVYFNFQPDASNQPQMELSSGNYHSNSDSQPTGNPLYIDVAWEDSSIPFIHYASSLRYPKIVARPGSDLTITINKSAKTFTATRNAGVATIDGQSYTTVEAAFAALEQMSGKTLNITKSATTSRSLELGNGNILCVRSGDLTFTGGATITVPAGQSGEIGTGHFKTNSTGYLVHVYGTLKYSNTEIYNDNAEGGVFILYDGATLNQSGGGINSPNVAVEIASPTARYNFSGGGININDKYAGTVFFNFQPNLDNQPQMTLNTGVCPANRPLQVKVVWESAHVPVIAFSGSNLPNVVSVNPEEIGLDIDTQTRIITAGKPQSLTIPVVGNEQVHADAAINGTTAQIKEMDGTQLETLLGGTNDAVSIDLSTAENEIRAVDLPASLIDSIAEDEHTDSLKVTLKTGSVELDNGVLQTVANTAPEGGATNVRIQLEEKQESAMTEQQTRALADMEISAAITVGLSVNNSTQISDFAGGTATIRIPFNLDGAPITDIAVWYLSPDGRLELQSGVTYADGFLSWTVGHFSDYVVERGSDLSFAGKLTARPGATVTLTLSRTDGNRRYTLTLPADGSAQDFTFDRVHPGQYTLEITQPGALTVTIEGIALNSQSLALVETVALPIGDLDGNGRIDADDLAVIRSSNNYFRKVANGANPLCDLNGDSIVNVADAAILRSPDNYGKTNYTITLIQQG